LEKEETKKKKKEKKRQNERKDLTLTGLLMEGLSPALPGRRDDKAIYQPGSRSQEFSFKPSTQRSAGISIIQESMSIWDSET
jgi:hypothetical protein